MLEGESIYRTGTGSHDWQQRPRDHTKYSTPRSTLTLHRIFGPNKSGSPWLRSVSCPHHALLSRCPVLSHWRTKVPRQLMALDGAAACILMKRPNSTIQTPMHIATSDRRRRDAIEVGIVLCINHCIHMVVSATGLIQCCFVNIPFLAIIAPQISSPLSKRVNVVHMNTNHIIIVTFRR